MSAARLHAGSGYTVLQRELAMVCLPCNGNGWQQSLNVA
jgi:hypothetical protein